MPLCLLLSNDGQGLRNDDGGLPTWCVGGAGGVGDKDAIGVTVIIFARAFPSRSALGLGSHADMVLVQGRNVCLNCRAV
jgi:hypothetical protein